MMAGKRIKFDVTIEVLRNGNFDILIGLKYFFSMIGSNCVNCILVWFRKRFIFVTVLYNCLKITIK